jgi:hypothetical protein
MPVVLRNGEEAIDLLAFVDTGASNCLFEREHGELLGLEIETGEPKTTISTRINRRRAGRKPARPKLVPQSTRPTCISNRVVISSGAAAQSTLFQAPLRPREGDRIPCWRHSL